MVTNIDPEHMDHYKNLDALKAAFVEFCNRVPFYGLNVLCLDHPNVQALLPQLEKRFVTYGSSHAADYRLEDDRARRLHDDASARSAATRTWASSPCAWWARTTR